MQKFYFLSNNLFTTYALQEDFPRLYDFSQDLTPIFDSIKSLYNIAKFSAQNEHQFEDDFISQVLTLLDWKTIRQEIKIIQGKQEKPDFLLFTTSQDKSAYESIPTKQKQSTQQYISVILESKAYNIEIDNKKVQDNPHFQLLRYLNALKLDYGFLTNGRFWRFYDNSKLSSQKVFYEVNLESIIQKNDIEAFKYFYFIFHASNFTQASQSLQTPIQTIIAQNTTSKTQIEDDLKSIIYGINGRDSVFEKIGSCLYAKHPTTPLTEIYENSLYFIFRLLFIAYFEDKFSSLLEQHTYYNDHISINNLLTLINQNPQNYNGFVKLNEIFSIFDKGEPNYDMPIFNGGLFDTTHSKLLNTPKLFSNKDLQEILESLFFTSDDLNLRRDYKTLSITHLGTIYEGILSYFFEVAQEDTYYLTYNEKAKTIEGYFDSYDLALLQKKHKNLKITHYPKGKLYLKNTSNSRKTTASFYTPTSLTSYLAEHLPPITDENILNLKILDNACGSGHFLVQALNTIAHTIITDFDSFPSFKSLYEQEAKIIRTNTAQYIQDYEVDESDIIKRLLLKRIIYGVDLNPFSVELTKLSLWIDSFIFGTPLSFIEHHIKCGNALVGSSIKDFKSFYTAGSANNLLYQSFLDQFQALTEALPKLNALKDTTEEEIKESKTIYTQEIAPKLHTLSLALDFLTAQSFLKEDQAHRLKDREMDYIEGIISSNEIFTSFHPIISKLSQDYRFFHYEIAFPEVFSSEKKGFDCIIGNPPWDKSEFSDNDFFPQFISDYRTKKNNEKKQIALDLLAKPHIKALYDTQKAHTDALNIYYKSHYPLNRGGKDLNLFRLFVERNLNLLAPNASLNYVLPSALMYEEGSYTLRCKILQECSLTYFYSFENNQGIFPDVHRSYKFALMQILNTPPSPTHTISTKSYLTHTDALEDSSLQIPLTLQEIAIISPTQLALPEVRNKEYFSILLSLYQTFPSFDFKWIDFRQELNMTTDKGIFIEGSGAELLPLYEGKMIHQNNAHFSTPSYFLDPLAFDTHLQSKELYRIKQDLQMDSKTFEDFCSKYSINALNSIGYDREFIRLGFRGIARDTDERTLIFSLIPKDCGVGHSMFINTPKIYFNTGENIQIHSVEIEKILFALGVFNSIVVDFIARSMVQINVSKTYINRIPFPQPSSEEIRTNPLYTTISRNALALQRYHDTSSFKALDSLFGSNEWVQITKYQGSYGLGGEPLSIPKTPKSYLTLKASTDILIAKLYGLNKEEFCTLLSTFKVLNDKQPQYIELLKGMWESVEVED